MLVLTMSEVRAVFSMADAIEAVARGAREYSEGRAVIPPRTRVLVEAVGGSCMYMPGLLPALGALGAKVICGFPGNPARGLPVGPGVFLLQDAETGRPLALMDSTYLTDVRTGALTGLAARYLARPDSRTAAIIGSGAQARTQLLALAEVLPLERAAIWSRDPANVAAFLAEMGPRLPRVRLEAAESAESAVRAADVAVAATSARSPVILGDWPRPDAFVASCGHPRDGSEVDHAVVLRAGLVAADARQSVLRESGDLRPLVEAGRLREADVAELGELVAGRRPGRRRADELTYFKSLGFAAVDLSCGQEIYRLARARGLGTEIEIGA